MNGNDRELAQAAATVFEACAEAFLNEPVEAVVEDVRLVASALGPEAGASWVACEALEQRMYDRVIVPTSPFYVPLFENCIAVHVRDGVYGPLGGVRCSEVAKCYKAAGFDYRSLAASPSIKAVVHADYIGCECAFLAFLKRCEAESADEAGRAHINDLARQFARSHAGLWFSPARDLMAEAGEDFYTDVATLAESAVRVYCG